MNLPPFLLGVRPRPGHLGAGLRWLRLVVAVVPPVTGYRRPEHGVQLK